MHDNGSARPRVRWLHDSTTIDHLTVESLTVDLDAGVASRDGRVLKLWPKQFALLVYLMQHPNQIVSRREIAENVWGDEMAIWTNVIAVNINGLRKEIERDGLPTLLHTVRGRGYVLGEPPA
jgi:DNA-binding response OmpR family regulator